ncbi:MAG TPA: type II toxin-antitoxin system VapC family toxin [Gammaproteobacteria bacterium]|nr:type II toxin-antitoxin system VapC family toxin [Gammaproteobacteria bacterium]
MRYLVDTCVLSELRKRHPHPGVVAWIEPRPPISLYLSVLTLGEIRKGIGCLADGARKFRLLDWLETELPTFFAGRIVPIDTQVADCWGRLVAEAGRSLPTIDSLLAATALVHDLVLVTRNVKDFGYAPLEIVNPWD